MENMEIGIIAFLVFSAIALGIVFYLYFGSKNIEVEKSNTDNYDKYMASVNAASKKREVKATSQRKISTSMRNSTLSTLEKTSGLGLKLSANELEEDMHRENMKALEALKKKKRICI